MTIAEFNRFLEDVKTVRSMINEIEAEKVPYLFPEPKEGMEVKIKDRVRVGEIVYQAREEFIYSEKNPPDQDPRWFPLRKRGN